MYSKIYNHILYNFIFPDEDSLNILIEKEKEKNNKYGIKCSDNINCIIITTIFLGIISMCPIIFSISFQYITYYLLMILPIIFLDCYFGFLSKKYYKMQKISSNKIVKLYSVIDLYNDLNFSPIEELKIINNQIELAVNRKKYKYEINNEIISNNEDNVTINFNMDDINENIICEVYYGTDNLVDKNNSTLQFNFSDIDKMKKNKIKSENREFALNISIIIIICSITLYICSFLLLFFSYSTMDKIIETNFTLVMTWIMRIDLIILIIDAFVFAVLKTGGTNYNYGIYNDIIALYDYIYKDDFSDITFSILKDNNNICLDHSSYTYLDFPMIIKTTKINIDKTLDVDYIIDIGISNDTYFCNIIKKG